MVKKRTTLQKGLGPQEAIKWLGPLPIWATPSPVGLRLDESHNSGRPALLRFANDDFMEEFISTLATEPQRLGELQAQPETWRRPMASPGKQKSDPQETSKVAFIYDKTHEMTKARKVLPTAINLQPGKKLFGKRVKESATTPDEEQLPLKLYQASQKRHYLVSASLIVDEPGMPDCQPNIGKKERVSFVIRRLLPPENGVSTESEAPPMERWDEYAFVSGGNSSAYSWRRIGAHGFSGCRKLITGEEQIPMFPVNFAGSCGSPRRLLSGVIPVSRREQWVGAELGADADSVEAGTPQSLAERLLWADVVAPWKLLLEQAEWKRSAADAKFSNFGSDSSAEKSERDKLLRSSRDEIQTGSWYVLLDFARFLKEHLPSLWQALIGNRGEEILDDGEQQLLQVLKNTTLPEDLAYRLIRGEEVALPLADNELSLGKVLHYLRARATGATGEEVPGNVDFTQAATVPSSIAPYRYEQVKWTLADALVAAFHAENGLEGVETTLTRFTEAGLPLGVDSNWPDFLFPLADPEFTALRPAVLATELTGLSGVERQQAAVETLAVMVSSLIPADPSEEGPPLIDSVPVGDPRDVWFVVRCVYERPNCGPLFTTLVSEATARFQMAPFFDPDAPVRPVRIPMPLDISPAGLRKYQKNTGFVISDMLCAKIKGMRKMTFADLVLSVLPWPFHKDLSSPGSGTCEKDGNSFGMICSLSIPIVTLCALILMMIIVALFDLIFRWIPYLFVCLPIPGLKGKKE